MQLYLVATIVFYFFYIMMIGLFMFLKRKKAVQSGEIRMSYFRDYSQEVPSQLKVISNHFNNQFQVPVFFVMAGILAISLNKVTLTFNILATLFILSRILHSIIHLGTNNVLYRAFFFFTGVFIVAAMFVSNLL
ncbi:MAG: hypothetical protein Fur0010_18210 [Bdellovibrio sp.]